MRVSERIELIKRVATALAGHEWPDIDLILRQYGLPWSDTWSGESRYGYALNFVEEASNDVLEEMAEHLLGRASSPAISADVAGIWPDHQFRMFISHSSLDKQSVTRLKKDLDKYGIYAFVAHEDIKPTAEWQKTIETALGTCHAAIAILTPNFRSSCWTDQELGYCLKRGLLIIPFRMGADPHGFLNRFQALTPTTSMTEIGKSVFDILVRDKSTAVWMPEALVDNFVRSGSFEAAKRNVMLLERIDNWTPDLTHQVQEASDTNDQIRNAFGVPARVKALLLKVK